MLPRTPIQCILQRTRYHTFRYFRSHSRHHRAAKTWSVNTVNGSFSPAIIDIASGDTVRWPNADGPDHAFVQTEPGYRSCTPKSGGFNPGRKTVGKSYRCTFQSEGEVSYKGGIGASYAKLNSTGTIYVGPRLADAVIEKINAACGEPTTTVSGSTSATETATTAGAASTLHGATTTLSSITSAIPT
ncbi:hypothetical protein BGZ79_009237 [Entomortierella chlamydospora]|nr:hypothetical protein BGZ79_009237 [Entomortierella chlamydospora]